MDKVYKHQNVEQKWYKLWEENGYFTPKIDDTKKPFSILLPLPNANDPMHMGHAMFTVQDILIRYHRMKGDPTLWLPGGDHAGIETQFVFEKKLAKEGKSRLDFDRETLFKMIAEFVEENKNINRDQMKRLGFSLDWMRYHYSLEPKIVATVIETFKKLYNDGLVYRDDRLVNYCTKCGTSYSDLEIKHVERIDPLYYLKYGPFVLATVRPETKFGDTAVAVYPKDKRYKKWIGKEIEAEGLIGKFKIKVIGDSVIDPKFGTGVAKVTPAHDFTDFEIAKRHNLPSKQVIGFDGRLNENTGPYAGLKVKAAREKVVNDLVKHGLMDHVDNSYTHTVSVCYKCGTVIEPLPLPQWYVKMKPLAALAMAAVKSGKTKIVPLKRFEKMYFDWLNNILDWNISRQIVWGPRIPVWHKVEGNEKRIWASFIDNDGKLRQGTIDQFYRQKIDLKKITNGMQRVMVPIFEMKGNQPEIYIGENPPTEGSWIQETDTFDTWFLSGQWPLTTLGFPDSQDFRYFYPTSLLDTMWDILFFWVARMMMLGIYRSGDVPFRVIHLHSRVVDAHGQKMSKSKGNVMNPIDMVDKYGADALRFALIFGAAPGSDIAISDDKIRGMRNFSNKLWNIGRFIKMNMESFAEVNIQINEFNPGHPRHKLNIHDKKILSQLGMLERGVTKNIENYRFDKAAERLYEFIWHTLADKYIEGSKAKLVKKDSEQLSILIYIYTTCLKLLHPFMPFITEELYKQLIPAADPLIISSWPKV